MIGSKSCLSEAIFAKLAIDGGCRKDVHLGKIGDSKSAQRVLTITRAKGARCDLFCFTQFFWKETARSFDARSASMLYKSLGLRILRYPSRNKLLRYQNSRFPKSPMVSSGGRLRSRSEKNSSRFSKDSSSSNKPTKKVWMEAGATMDTG